MDVKKITTFILFVLYINLSAQSNNRFLVNGIFEINNSDITNSENFKMVSLPGDTTIPVKKILTGELGYSWMAFNETGLNYPIPYLQNNENDFIFSPGKAFWIISKNNINLGPFFVKKVPLKNNSYSIKLHKGWNLISNPFDKSIDWKSVRQANNLQNDLIYYFYEGYYDNSSVKMQPYLGYYFFNRKNLDELILPYPSNLILQKKEEILNFFKLNFIRGNDTSSIVLYFNNTNVINQLYPINDFIQFGATIKINDNYYSQVLLSKIEDIYKFPLKIINKKDEEVTVFLDKNTDINYSDIQIALNSEGNITPISNSPIKLIKLDNIEMVIAKKELLAGNNYSPSIFHVKQNFPNPFNPETKINILIPEEDIINISVFNSLGKKVTEIFSGKISEGEHSFNFNGKQLASGLYFYTVTSKFGTITKKMLLLK
ncbi:MAG TPA: T9SS type A sorting domain-containing protein [Melioribacteraceae bacterium]|nr:T9SS type A sorting domain-containing protein [Melioribacteraceae bacterium]